ncbi:sugar phosphate isomerase/epimerase family protein [Nocardia sp. NPDC050799]|uniref:sugar phosphate isomerase/epimerase family protein n=1 Tax=Nocardia TaxID=1817 RepID=UPI0007A755E7|nr:sugar phosphate isomerase/epimerase family protein [Nocardia fusca]
MIVGIDSYCFHRYFGEVYPGLETEPADPMNVPDMIDRVADFGADAVSIESFMLGPQDTSNTIGRRIRDRELDVLWAWGHPDGLGSGANPQALEDLYYHVDFASEVGATVMRICAGGRRTRPASWSEHKDALLPLLVKACAYATDRGITLAMENHIDFTAAQAVEIVEAVGSSSLGLCLDTGNQLRMLEDPKAAIRSMAPYAKACHFKDVTAYKGDPTTFGFWPSVATGDGLIDFEDALQALSENHFEGILALEIDYHHPDNGTLDEAIERSLVKMRSLVENLADSAVA